MNEWLYDEDVEAVFCQETGAEIARLIHGTTDDGRTLTDSELDAAGRLIAAAPVLLAYLKEAAAIVPFGGIAAKYQDIIEEIEGTPA